MNYIPKDKSRKSRKSRKAGKAGENRKPPFDRAIDEIKRDQVFSGIKDQLGPLVETPPDLDTFTDGVMVAFRDKAARDKAARDNKSGVDNCNSPIITTGKSIINNKECPDTDTKVIRVSEATRMTPSELIKAVKELTETPVCKRNNNNLNVRIMRFLKDHGIEVDISTLRKALTRGVRDAQQMIDMWGQHVTNYAKSGESTCYLCGKKIYPHASCPEMEHKLPATTAYSSMTHYHRLKGYHGNEDKSMYRLWKDFVNDNVNARALKKLYQRINEQERYGKKPVDDLYGSIFVEFWKSTEYSLEDNEHTKILKEFFKYFIKGWLLEFAYSHHTCNQSKSDFYIYNNMQQFNKMKTGAMTREKQRKDAKVKVEAREFGTATNHQQAIIDRRRNMGVSMYEHFIETIYNYYKHYKQVNDMVGTAEGLKYLIEDGDTIEERLVMIKALYLVIDVKSESNKEKKSEKKQGGPSQTQEPQEDIDTAYEKLLGTESEILEKESEILEKKAKYDGVNRSERRKNQIKGEISGLQQELKQLQQELNKLKPKLEEQVTTLEKSIEHYKNENDGEHPITCNFDCVASEEITSATLEQLSSDREEYVDNVRGSSSDATYGYFSPIQTHSRDATYGYFSPFQTHSRDATDIHSGQVGTGSKLPNTDTENLKDNLNKIKKFRPGTTGNNIQGQAIFSQSNKRGTKRKHNGGKRRTKRKGKTKRKK